MDRPRITIVRNSDGVIEILLNETGRDLLVRELLNLSESNDHFHLGPEALDNEVPLRTVGYQPGDEVIDWAKILFRTDKWDAECFPHVLDG